MAELIGEAGTVAPAIAARRLRIAPGALALLASLPLLALVLYVAGRLPGSITDGPWTYLTKADISCLHDLGASALTTSCHAYGQPLGYPLLSNGPVVALGVLLTYLPGVGVSGAYLASGAFFLALAMAGGYGLLRRLGTGRTVALVAAFAYLLSPSMVGVEGFGGTYFGFALLPAYALADLLVLERLDRSGRRGIALGLAAYALLRTTALFLDGYSFIASALVSLCLWVAWAAPRRPLLRRALIGAGALALANVVAIGVYQLYVPGRLYTDPLDSFRSMGVDVVTLVTPSGQLWLPRVLGVYSNHTGLWGDGTNTPFNYVGIVVLALALWAVIRMRRRPAVLALAAVALVATVLSLGPSLKIDDHHPATGPLAAQSGMPASAADLSFPWGPAFTKLPGLEDMRATNRWFGASRLALIVLAALALDAMVRRPTRRDTLIAAGLAAVAMAELAPNLSLIHGWHTAQAQAASRLLAQVEPGLRRDARGARRAFFLNDNGELNDYIVNQLAVDTGMRTYSVGGDKNVVLSMTQWPAAVRALGDGRATPDKVASALRSGDVDVVIATYFNTRLAAYGFPPGIAQETQARRAFAPILRDPRFVVHRHRWFATVRLAHR